MGPTARRSITHRVLNVLGRAAVVGALLVGASPATAQPAPELRILVFSKTAGFRHPSIVPGVSAIQQLGAANGIIVDATEDGGVFTASQLDGYGAVVFLSTTGDVLTPEQQAAFEQYIANGGGFVGIHSATDTEYDWAWYGHLVGAHFLGHGAPQQSTLVVEDRAHESTAFLGDTWQRVDEWYDFRDNPRDRVHVLLSIDPATITDSQMTTDHPIAWCHEFDGGRAWYTALGHTDESWTEPDFLQHVLGGIRTAAGVTIADCAVTTRAETEPTAASSTVETVALPSTTTPTPDVTNTAQTFPELTSSDSGTNVAIATGVIVLVAIVATGTVIVVRRRRDRL